MVLMGGKIITISHSVLYMTTKRDRVLSVFFPMFYFPCISASTAFIPSYMHTRMHTHLFFGLFPILSPFALIPP